MRKDEFPIVDKLVKDSINDVLDKIKAEIISLTDGDTPEHIWNVDALEIIDKYRTESEDRE